jgi:hypothetical protein
MPMHLTDGQIAAIRYLNQTTVNVFGLTVSHFQELNEDFVLGDFYNFVSKALTLGVGPELLVCEITSVNNLLFAEAQGEKITIDLIKTTVHAVGCEDEVNAMYNVARFLEVPTS